MKEKYVQSFMDGLIDCFMAHQCKKTLLEKILLTFEKSKYNYIKMLIVCLTAHQQTKATSDC